MTLGYVLINQQKKRNKHKARIRRNQRIVMTRWTMLPGAKSTKLGFSSLYKQFKVGIFVSRCKKYKVGILFNVQKVQSQDFRFKVLKYNVRKRFFLSEQGTCHMEGKNKQLSAAISICFDTEDFSFFQIVALSYPHTKQLSRAQHLYLYDVYILNLKALITKCVSLKTIVLQKTCL